MAPSSWLLASDLQATVSSGSSFWGGLSGSFAITNTSQQSKSSWSFSFVSSYSNFDFWNADESAVRNSDGTFTITVKAPAGASPLAAGARLDMGFTVTSDSDATVTVAEAVLGPVGATTSGGSGTTSSGGDSSSTSTSTSTTSSTSTTPAAGSTTTTGTSTGTTPDSGTSTPSGSGGLVVEIQLGGAWSGAYEGTLTVRNSGSSAVAAGWSVSFVSDHRLGSVSDFQVQQQLQADGRTLVTLSAPNWAASQGLAAGASLSSYFQAQGDRAGQSVAELFSFSASGGGSSTTTDGSSGGSTTTTGGSTTTGDDGGSPLTSAPTRLVGYFEEWGIYGRNFRVADVKADQLTHLNYSFFGITPTQSDLPYMAKELNVLPGAMVQAGYLGFNSNTPGGLGIHDTWAAVEKTFSQADQLVSRRFDAGQWQGLSESRRQGYLSGGEFEVIAQADGSRLVRAKADTWTDSQGGIQRIFNKADWDGLSDARRAYLVTNGQQYNWTDQWQGTFSPGSGSTSERLAAVNNHFAAGAGRTLTLKADGDLVRNSSAWVGDDPANWQKLYAGNLNQLRLLKELNPELSIGFAVGGWTLSGNFSTNLDDAAGREIFTQSIVDHLSYYDFFSTVDFDWEYPGGGGLDTNASNAQDGANFALTLQLLDQKLATFAQRTGREIEISVATAGGADKLSRLNLQGINSYVDFYNVMTYDFHGGWEKSTGHQAAMRGDSGGYDVVTAIDQFRQAGIAMDKVVLGAPGYTRAWGGVAAGSTYGYSMAGDAALAPGSYEKGNYDQKDLITGIENNSYQLVWDDTNKAAFAYNASTGIWSSIETSATIAGKAAYVREAGLAGMMFWALSNDSSGAQSLVGAANDALRAGVALDTIAGRAPAFDAVLGGDGRFSFSDFTSLT
jgi:GH18 family chitinase